MSDTEPQAPGADLTPSVTRTPAPLRLPGAPRTSFTQPPTAPLDVPSATSGPAEDGTADGSGWMSPPSPAPVRRGLAAWALAAAILGLGASLVVGWAFPVGVVAIVTAVIALRRPLESRAVAVWALALGGVALVYSAGWLIYAALRS